MLRDVLEVLVFFCCSLFWQTDEEIAAGMKFVFERMKVRKQIAEDSFSS